MVTIQNGQPSAVLHTREILLGTSGSGKSMLLCILVGLLRASSGQVLFRGGPQRGPNPSLSVAFRSFALFPWLTVLQNVELGLQAQNLLKALRLKRSLATIDTIGLNGFEDTYPKELSGGMCQRVDFARALVVELELLFMDGLFGALDVLTAPNLRKELLLLWRKQKIPTRAIVMAMHNIEDTVSMADRTDPGHIHVELAGLPIEKRLAQHDEYTSRVALIYKLMSNPHTNIEELLSKDQLKPLTDKLVPARPMRAYQTLRHVEIGDVIGLIELVHAQQGRADIYQLGRDLHLEADNLLPLADAADLLDLADLQEGNLLLTETGKCFAEANVLEERQIFRTQALACAGMLRRIVTDLQQDEGHTAQKEPYLAQLAQHFSENEARAQLETIIDWGHYAELFSYVEDCGVFRQETEEVEEEA